MIKITAETNKMEPMRTTQNIDLAMNKSFIKILEIITNTNKQKQEAQINLQYKNTEVNQQYYKKWCDNKFSNIIYIYINTTTNQNNTTFNQK